LEGIGPKFGMYAAVGFTATFLALLAICMRLWNTVEGAIRVSRLHSLEFSFNEVIYSNDRVIGAKPRAVEHF
jgi:hypothetical protein